MPLIGIEIKMKWFHFLVCPSFSDVFLSNLAMKNKEKKKVDL